MKRLRLITITVIILAVLAFFWASASTASAGYIDELTLAEINGPKISDSFRSGVLAGVLHAVLAAKSITCPMMSPNMLKAGLESALLAREITPDWTVFHASLYVMVQAGCAAPATEKPNV